MMGSPMKRIASCTCDDLKSIIDNLFFNPEAFSSVEEASKTLAKGMCEEFRSGQTTEIVLSRVFHSFDFELLPPDIQTAGIKTLGSTPSENSKFLVLLGTHGDEPDWCDRRKSFGHQAIPLNPMTLTTVPMIARLFQQIGFDLGIISDEKKNTSGVAGSYGVFYVPTALGSSYIPAQGFVKKYEIKSVIGTGVMLPEGDIGVYLAFCRTSIPEAIAPNFSALMSLFWQKNFLIRERGMFS